MSTISIRDVAKVAGVSTATVSYVLNDSRPVTAATRTRVLEAVEQLGYQPNATARSLQAQRTHLIGYSWPAIPARNASPILDRFIHSLGLAAYHAGYHLLAFPSPSSRDEVAVYRDLVKTNRVDGIILSATNIDDPRVAYLSDTKMPFVAFGRSNDDAPHPWVDVDGSVGVQLAVEHLVAQGYGRVGMLAWPRGSRSGRDRYEGYREGLRQAGLSYDERWVARVEHDADKAYQGMMALLQLPPAERPTAVVCVSDLVAIGAMNAIQDAGLRVGADIGVVGFDDIPLAQYLSPSLTSVHQPIDKIGQLIMEQLLKLMNRETLATSDTHILLRPQVVHRASTGRID